MSAERRLEELRARLDLSRGSASLVLVLVDHDAAIEDTKRALAGVIGSLPMAVADLGACDVETGPARWAELTRARAADAYLLSFAPQSPLSGPPFARLLNAERELLRRLAGPLVLVVSGETERVLRRHAPDFFTWIAQTYELPAATEIANLAKRLGAAPAAVEPVVPDEEPIRFLHVSDIHLRPGRVSRYDQDRVLRGLMAFLERDRAGFPLDVMFVTGDLAQSGAAGEYALVVEFLKRLMDATGVPRERVFVVPGNHDVDRNVGKWLLRTLGKDEEAVAFFEDAKSRAFHTKKLEAYRHAMSELLGDGRPLGLAVGEDAVEMVEVRGSRMAVASFNTAWFAQGDDDKGKLWLGEPNVDRAGQRIADLEARFAVALMHHPLDELHELERDNVGHYLERSFDLLLRGHLHKDKTRAIATQRGGYVEVAGPAAYQGSQWPNGCFLGEIRPEARKVRLRPQAYASGADGWVLDTKVFPDDASEGYVHTFAVTEKRRLKSAATRRLAKAAEEAVRDASPAELESLADQLGVTRSAEAPRRVVVQRTVSAARAQVVDPALWRDSQEHMTELTLVARCNDILHADNARSGGRISPSEPRFLERGLSRIAGMVRELRGRGSGEPRLAPGVLDTAWRNMRVVFNAPCSPRYAPPWSVELWGAAGGPDDQHAVIVVPALPDVAADRESGLGVLDTYLESSHAAHGALVLFNALSPAESEPQLDHAKTPAGRDVLLLRL